MLRAAAADMCVCGLHSARGAVEKICGWCCCCLLLFVVMGLIPSTVCGEDRWVMLLLIFALVGLMRVVLLLLLCVIVGFIRPVVQWRGSVSRAALTICARELDSARSVVERIGRSCCCWYFCSWAWFRVRCRSNRVTFELGFL